MKSENSSALIIKILAIALGVVIVAMLALLIFVQPAKSPTVQKPVAVMSPDGRVSVTLPQPGDDVASPVAIEGSVTGGGWFFEGSFPIKILNADGKTIGHGTAQALSDWMSTGTVPFSASILFATPVS